MTELKNTPWKVREEVTPQYRFHYVEGFNGEVICGYLDEPTAKAIAALPETLKLLRELQKAASEILENWESGDGTTRVAGLMQTLKKVLET